MPRPATRNGRAEDRVFNAIIDAVLDHRLAPGTQLKERELCEIFRCSRGAVRGALTRLGHILLVELRPNRGAIIANPSLEETRDMFEARRALEAAIVQRLARSLNAKGDETVAQEISAEVLDLTRRFPVPGITPDRVRA